jgi:hypothetical protein
MPIGLLIPVVLAGWGTGCVLTSWRHLGGVARVPALVTSELPFLGCYLLIASTAGAWPTGNRPFPRASEPARLRFPPPPSLAALSPARVGQAARARG